MTETTENTLTWKAKSVLEAVHGQSLQEQSWTATGVSIDSRTLQPGDLFIALQGPSHDGHDHVAAAFANGASAAIVHRQPAQTSPLSPLLMVNDTFLALESLGRAGRERAQGRIIGLTGSVGKTGTKEMLRLMLADCGTTYATEGSLNNHWGVPLSLARLPATAQFGVFEMGMNHAGEIDTLTKMVRPHVALITTVEPAHLEYFASVEAIADAKAEIFNGLDAKGTAILNRDNPHYQRLLAACKAKGIKHIRSFGQHEKADARLISYNISNTGSLIEAKIDGKLYKIQLGCSGRHLANNALGALLAADAAGAKIETCIAALGRYQPPKGRGEQSVFHLPQGDITLIDESYNASPASIRAVIAVLVSMQPPKGGRRILVLGDMKEMGKDSAEIHAELGRAITAEAVDLVFCCGEMMGHLYKTLPLHLQGGYAANSAALAPLVLADLRAGDILTVKGSNSMAMERIISALHSQICTTPVQPVMAV